jgi:ferredoxin
MPRVTVKVDPSLCITAANCVGVTGELFQINEEGFAEVRDPKSGMSGYELQVEVTEEQAELLEEAAVSCPTRAILVSND